MTSITACLLPCTSGLLPGIVRSRPFALTSIGDLAIPSEQQIGGSNLPLTYASGYYTKNGMRIKVFEQSQVK